jgi:hypothetical protein
MSAKSKDKRIEQEASRILDELKGTFGAKGPTSAQIEMLKEMARLAEARLEAQLTTSLGADGRAVQFMSAMLGLVVLLIGAAVTLVSGVLLSGGNSSSGDMLRHLALIASVGAVGLLAAAIMAGWSLRPIRIVLPGNLPLSWLDDLRGGKNLEASLPEQVAYYQAEIEHNRDVATSNSKVFFLALSVAAFAVIGCGVWAGLFVGKGWL